MGVGESQKELWTFADAFGFRFRSVKLRTNSLANTGVLMNE